MKKSLSILFTLLLLCSACESEPVPVPTSKNVESTLIMFFPWSTDLKTYFDQNIYDLSTTITSGTLDDQRIIVCIETVPDNVSIIELKETNGICTRDTITSYTNTQFTTETGLTTLFNMVKDIAPANKYSMIIGCHGMAWLPKTETSQSAKRREPLHYEIEGAPLTRYFGGKSSQYQIETSTLAKSIVDADMKMDFILFDDCYMSSVEVAYDLKDATHYLIASPNEIMAYGFPYHKCGEYLLGNTNYNAVCYAFYEFYRDYEYPYGTIAVTDCTELDNLAAIVKDINLNSTNENINVDDIQKMDGYSPTIFYDLEDLMRHKCSDDFKLNQFIVQLEQTVPYKYHTQQYFTNRKGPLSISTFCGITTSDLSTNSLTGKYSETAWYAATH